MNSVLLLIFILCLNILLSGASSASCTVNYLVKNYICQTCPGTSTLNCQKTFTVNDLGGYLGASKSTIGTWVKFLTPITDDYTSVLHLSTNSSPDYIPYYRYQSFFLVQNYNVLASQWYDIFITGTNNQTALNMNTLQDTWYFYYSSAIFDSVLGATYWGVYDPAGQGSLDKMLFWKNTTFDVSITFGNDVILLLAGFFSYMSTSSCVAYSGTFAIPDYIEDNNVIFRQLGFSQPEIIAIYRFSGQLIQTIQDESGNNYVAYLGTDPNNQGNNGPNLNPANFESITEGFLFTGNQLITSTSIPIDHFYDAPGILGISTYLNFVRNNSGFCQTRAFGYQIILSILSANKTSLVLVTQYQTNEKLKLGMLNPNKTVSLFNYTFNSETWYQINVACKDYNQSSSSKFQDCFLYLPDTQQYFSVRLSSFNSSQSSSVNLVLGDANASFCGYLDKFTLFTNTTDFQNVSDGCTANCSTPLGTINPVCLGLPTVIPSCQSNEYLDPVILECSTCPINCTSCNSTSCTVCNADHSLQSNGLCTIQCSQDCLNCTSPQECTACLPNYFLFNGTCANTCPNGYYGDSTLCTQCSQGCLNCTSPQACTACVPNYFLFNGTCVNTCPNGYYGNSTLCTQCSQGCLNCTSPQECTACLSNYFLFNGACVNTCPNGYYGNSTVCTQCNSACTTCSGPDTTSCLSCIDSLLYYNGTCVPRCPLSTLQVGKQCIQCATSCAVCSNDSIKPCALCNSNKYLYQGICLTRCPTGYYQGVTSNGAAVCIKKLSISLELTQTSSPCQLMIQFSPLIDQNLILPLADVTNVAINGKILLSNNFSASASLNTILITLNLTNYLAKNSLITVSLNLQKLDNLPYTFDQTSASISSSEIYPLSNGTAEALSTASSYSNIFQTLTNIGQGAVIVIQGGFFMLTNNLEFSHQVTQMGRILSVNWPPNVEQFFAKTSLMTFIGLTIPNLRLFTQKSANTTESSASDSSHRLLSSTFTAAPTAFSVPSQVKSSLSSLDFLENTEPLLLTWVLILLIGSFIYMINQAVTPAIKPKNTPFKYKVLKWFDILVNWNLLLAHTFCIFFSVSFFALLQILAFIDGAEPVARSSVILAFICLAVQVILLILLYAVRISLFNSQSASRRKNKYKRQETENEANKFNRLSCVTASCKTDRKICLLYLPFLLTRMLAVALLFVFLLNFPLTQSAVVLVINVLFTLYCLIWRPLNKRYLLWLTFAIEILLITMSSCILEFAIIDSTEDTLDFRTKIGTLFIVCYVGIMLLGVVILAIQAIAILWSLILYCKQHQLLRIILIKLLDSKKNIQKTAGMKDQEEEESHSVEQIFAVWRKTILLTSQEDWTKPSNREKLQEMINWTRSFPKDSFISVESEKRNLEMPSKIECSIVTETVLIPKPDPKFISLE